MAVCEREMFARMPIVVILGATGTGKSKLAIEIGKLFNGEIVSADSMQLYKGLDIITNKVTAEERRMVPHHMLDFLEPNVNLNVVDYRNMALKKVEELLEEGKLPLIVGGTNYYIESLLWKVLVAEEVTKGAKDEVSSDEEQHQTAADDQSNEELHKRLAEVDPEMARTLHPNNRRKVVRSLQVYEQLGKPHSQVLKEQRAEEGGGPLGGPLRFPNSCILWLRCDSEVLDKRLDDRVDDMLKAGLVNELEDFHRRYNACRLKSGCDTSPDYTKGIFQSIGFKEFHDYLMWMSTKDERKEEEGEKLFQTGVSNLKMVTRRYARRQVRWVNNRFLRQPNRQVPLVYGLDTTDPARWDELVLHPATKIVRALMAGEKPEDISPLPVVQREELSIEWDGEPKRCNVCDRLFVDPLQWKEHQTSKKHKRVLAKKNREKDAEELESKKLKTD